MRRLIGGFASGLMVLWVGIQGLAAQASKPDRLAGLDRIWKACGVPQIGFFDEFTTVIGDRASTVYYRQGDDAWAATPMTFNGTHALARLASGQWLIVDTNNHRLVQLPDLAGKGTPIIREEIAGVKTRRPHDVLVDPSGYVYVIDAKRQLFRFKDLNGPIDVWTFRGEELGYARSLSWFDGYLHVIDSSRGEVVRIDDYAQHRFTTFRSPRPKKMVGKVAVGADPVPGIHDFDGGALANTGLILNDVDKHGDWYYGTNFFAEPYAMGGDTRPARLIRWRRWEDFANGRWQDLSDRIPAGEPPRIGYYISIRDGILYTSAAPFEDPECNRTVVLRLDLASLPN